MRHAITSLFKSVLGVRLVISERKQFSTLQGDCSPMTTLATNLHHVCGGGGGQDLPKGGW